ncbi:MAG: hypothetical protein KDD34_00950 [Bdellovibrionales bacterium]|nr:hypothetical protein [Bdellovibrionales bacterium]
MKLKSTLNILLMFIIVGSEWAYSEELCTSSETNISIVVEQAEDFWITAFTNIQVLKNGQIINEGPQAAIGFGSVKQKRSSYKYAMFGIRVGDNFQFANFKIYKDGRREVELNNFTFVCRQLNSVNN